MSVISANRLNRFWQKGIKPIKEAVKAIQDKLSTIDSNVKNTKKPDNWKQATDLPSTYPTGETIFFSNNPTNKFNGLTYCTVHTIKGYTDNVPACIQFIYPYNDHEDKYYFREALYNSDVWRGWQEVITSANIGSQTVAHAGTATSATSATSATTAGAANTATTATKATQDGNGNNIANTYLPVNGNNAIKEVSTILKFGPTFGGICIDGYVDGFSFAKSIRFIKDNLYNYVFGMSGFTNNAGKQSFNTVLQDTKDVVGSSIFFGKPINETVYGIFGYNNYLNLGFSNNCFKTVYTFTGTVQASDREKKKDIKEFDDKFVEDFIMGLIPVSYMFKENESGRTHYGLIAQDVEELMNALNMDSKDFAGFIKSPRYKETIEEIEVENEVEDEDGKKKIVKEKRQNVKATLIENEYEYALRYEEFISPIIKMLQILNDKIDNQQQEINRLKQEIKKLKNM